MLFEIATELPGFTLDEKPKDSGRQLYLPPWMKFSRSQIEKILPAIQVPR
jgi:glyoxalase family protein